MVVGEDLQVDDIFVGDYYESVSDEEDKVYIIAPSDSDSSLEIFEEEFDFGVYLWKLSEVYKQKVQQYKIYSQDQFFKGIKMEEPGILMNVEYQRCIREVAIRLHQNYMIEDTMKILSYCLAFGTGYSLSSFYTGVVLRAISDKIKEENVPEVLEILMGRSTYLNNEFGKVVLSFIAYDIKSIKSSSGVIKRFLTVLMMNLPQTKELEDMKFIDNIISFYHRIYLDLKDDPSSIQNITSPILLDKLLALLDDEVVDRRDQHNIIEILAIMACNSRIVSHALMTKRAVLKLAQFNGIYGEEWNETETFIKMDIATIIWAVLPSLPRQDFFNNYEEISENYRLPIWRKEVREGIWVPFPPPISSSIELKFGKITESNYIDSGKIHTVNYQTMTVTNEATLEQTSIIRGYSGYYNVLNLKKSKQGSGKKRDIVSNCFIRFAVTFFCERVNFLYANSPEEYRYWQGLYTLFQSVTRQQYDEFLKKGRNELKAISIAERIRIILNGNNYDLRIIAICFASRLMDLNRKSFRKIFKENGMMSTIHSIAKQQDEVLNDSDDPELLQGNLNCNTKEKFLLDRAKAFVVKYRVEELLGDQAEVHTLRHMLERLMTTPTDTTQESSCRSRELKHLLDFLTKRDGPTDPTQRLKKFLHVFANIKPDSKSENSKTSNELFLILLKRLQSIVRDSINYRSFKWGEVTEEDVLRAGLETIGVIARKRINVWLSLDTPSIPQSDWKLKVYPFTTMQYFEWYVLPVRLHENRGEKPFGEDESEFQFFINENQIPSGVTIYEAICRFGNISGDKLFDMEYRIKCKRINQREDPVKRPVPVEIMNRGKKFNTPTKLKRHIKTSTEKKNSGFSQLPQILDRHLRERAHFKDIHPDIQRAMNLIGVLFALNEYWPSLYSEQKQEHRYIVNPKIFEMDSLIDKTEVAFSDLFAVLLGRSPSWIECTLENCPFVLDFQTRKQAFRILRLDRRRSFDTIMNEYVDDEEISVFTKWTMRRNNVLNDVNMALRRSSPHSAWSIEFENEIGSGVGLKRELFTLASRSLQKADLGMWCTSYITDTEYSRNETGLYPVITIDVDRTRNSDFEKSSLEEKFETLGLLLGKAIIEEQILDIPLAQPAVMWILKREKELTFDDMKHINPSVYKVLKDIQKMLGENEDSHSSSCEIEKTIASYDLSFVVPGHDNIELIPGGADIQVTLKNADNYIEKLQLLLLNIGVEKQMIALRRGLNSMVNLEHLQIFRPEELRSLICGEDNKENWTVENLKNCIKTEGFESHEMAVIEDLFGILSSLDATKRRLFLEFVTGCANLPVGGLKSLDPPLTITRSEESYPRAQTCFHTLHLPVNMSKSKLSQFIELAITEGLGYFGLA